MSLPKIVSGARAQVHVNGKLVGTLHNISYNIAWTTGDAYILGRLGPAAIEYTGAEPVSGTLAGWRVVKGGPTIVGLPQLKQLLTADYTTLTVFDRVSGLRIGVIQGVRLGGHAGGQAQRQLSEYSIPFKGMAFADESTDGAEPAGSSDLP